MSKLTNQARQNYIDTQTYLLAASKLKKFMAASKLKKFNKHINNKIGYFQAEKERNETGAREEAEAEVALRQKHQEELKALAQTHQKESDRLASDRLASVHNQQLAALKSEQRRELEEMQDDKKDMDLLVQEYKMDFPMSMDRNAPPLQVQQSAMSVQGGKKKTKKKKKVVKQKLHKGPRGGKYYIRKGRKVYV